MRLYGLWSYVHICDCAVNVASRVETTGCEGRIQVSERTMKDLEEWFNFEKRGSIFVKGKDNMTTYLYKGKKKESEDLEDISNRH